MMSDIAQCLRFFLSATDPESTTISPGAELVIGELLKHDPPLICIRHDQCEARYLLTEAGQAMKEAISA